MRWSWPLPNKLTNKEGSTKAAGQGQAGWVRGVAEIMVRWGLQKNKIFIANFFLRFIKLL